MSIVLSRRNGVIKTVRTEGRNAPCCRPKGVLLGGTLSDCRDEPQARHRRCITGCSNSVLSLQQLIGGCFWFFLFFQTYISQRACLFVELVYLLRILILTVYLPRLLLVRGKSKIRDFEDVPLSPISVCIVRGLFLRIHPQY
jgi:hypothetical protein